MTELAVDLTLARFVKLEQRITGAETDGLRARWEFGHELLRARDGKGRLPNGYITRLCQETGASRAELARRTQFAERFPTEEELLHACNSFRSWHAIVAEALPKSAAMATAEESKTLPLPDGVFRTVVADPPWPYTNKATRGAVGVTKGVKKHYATLSIEDIAAIPVAEHVADEAHLYLWTTNGFLREAFDVMDAWGFEYKTTLVWVKPQLGLGNYFRSSAEYILFGVRGGLRTADCNQPNWFRAEDEVIEAKRGRHSKKPGAFFDLIERASYEPFLEMFARERRLSDKQWDYWGNEA